MRCWLASEYSSCASPADLVALGDHFRRDAHHHVDSRASVPATQGCGLALRSVMLMLSTPPPMAASASSFTIWCAAIAMACRPEEQNRFTVVAATVTGSPARMRRDARDVRSLHAVRLRAAQDHVANLGGIERRRFAQNVLNAMRGQIVRTRHVE